MGALILRNRCMEANPANNFPAESIPGSISNFVMEKRMAHLKIIRVKKIRR
jgi:hypothetical protein